MYVPEGTRLRARLLQDGIWFPVFLPAGDYFVHRQDPAGSTILLPLKDKQKYDDGSDLYSLPFYYVASFDLRRLRLRGKANVSKFC